MPPKKKPIEKLKESVELDLEQRPTITDKAHKIVFVNKQILEALKKAKKRETIIFDEAPRPIIIEEPDVERANQLALSGEFCQPRFSEHRNCYILIRRKNA